MKRIFICIYLSLTVLIFSQVQFTDSNLPIIVFDTHGQSIPHDGPKLVIDMGIIYNGEGVRNSITDPFNNYDGKIAVRLRGQSSGWYPKHSWGFETQDDEGDNLDVSLLGLPEENDWVLHAPYADKTFMRNALTFKMSNDIGLWAPRTVFCELVINGDYHGIYVLMEKIKQDPNRVPISSPDEDISGGYLLEITDWGKIDPDEIYFVTNPTNKPIIVKYPKPSDLTNAQLNYITDYFNYFDAAVYGPDFMNPSTGFPNFLDAESTIKAIIINDLVKNIDAFHASSFMYKPKQEKLYMGPLWDFNVALGNYGSSGYYTTSGWISAYPKHKWVNQLFTDDYFKSLVYERWRKLIKTELEIDKIMQTIDDWAALLYEAQERNFERWPILGVPINPNYFVGETFEDEINYLKNWITERLTWITGEVAVEENKNITITEIYKGNDYGPYSYDWIELYNPFDADVDLSGYVLQTKNQNNSYTINNLIIPSSGYSIVGGENSGFNLLKNINVLSGTERITLFDPFDIQKDVVIMNFDSEPYFSIDPYMSSQLISPLLNNSSGSNWKLSNNIGGSPGFENNRDDFTIVINEILAKNNQFNFDEFWEYDDWIELYNYGEYPVDLAGLFITDDPAEPTKYQLRRDGTESTIIYPEEYKLLWTDEDPQQGNLHLGFRLDAEGEYLGIYYAENKESFVIDSISFGEQYDGISFGRIPIASERWGKFGNPTPGAQNSFTVDAEYEIIANISKYKLEPNYPNPFNGLTTFTYYLPERSFVKLRIFDLLGREVITLVNKEENPGKYRVGWHAKNKYGQNVASGIYFAVLEAKSLKTNSSFYTTSKIIYLK